PTRSIDGPRARVRFASSANPADGQPADSLEGSLQEVSDERIRLLHPHLGSLSILHSQLRELEPLGNARWLALDPSYHHFGDQVNVRFQVPYPEGSDRSWNFVLQQLPLEASLVLNVIGMEAMQPGGEFNKRLENDEWRTYATINGKTLDPLGL